MSAARDALAERPATAVNPSMASHIFMVPTFSFAGARGDLILLPVLRRLHEEL
ncbi:hypothetical protein [uncultured Cohaesibacter sp.]|uniref:hypothetical protein n=1 Tax=uncultured Cohaesibacter sp. TaxID=1002546 RepID=UPI0029C93AD0|nr:hypothetical protein [uncultured Cohaesibacter sp.]